MKSTYIKIVIASVILCYFFIDGNAQDSSHHSHVTNIFFRFSYQLLHSTHKDNFNGGSIDASYKLSPHFAAGLGVQYAGTPRHFDNGWILTNLRLLPVYINTIYTLCINHRLQPYVHTEEGISVNRYNKLDSTVSPQPYKVSEAGLYLSGNIGVSFSLSSHTKIFTEIGYKGYKHSTNDLDVNPHGFTARIGLNYKIQFQKIKRVFAYHHLIIKRLTTGVILYLFGRNLLFLSYSLTFLS